MTREMIDWHAIEQFVGFGPWDAPVVFVGMEEGLDKRADLRSDLMARSTYPRFIDMLKAQTALGRAGEYVGPNAKCQRTWRPMCDLMLRLSGEVPTPGRRRWYQGTRLGRIPGETLLVDLLPYPRNRADLAWPMEYRTRFKEFEDYKAALIGSRIELLKSAISAHPRKLIACYGKTYWPAFAKVVNVSKWYGDEKFRYGQDGDTGAGVILSTHYSLSAFNTDQQLQRFYEIAVSACCRLSDKSNPCTDGPEDLAKPGWRSVTGSTESGTVHEFQASDP